MPSFTVLTLAFFILLAIAGGIVGIMLEGKRIPQHSGAHNPATQDAVFPIVGWAALAALYLAVEHVGAGQLTPEFRMQLVALALLYATLATAWLIWRSGRRIRARMRGGEPVTWRAIPLLGALRFPILFAAVILAAVLEHTFAGFSINFFLLAGLAMLFALIRKPSGAT